MTSTKEQLDQLRAAFPGWLFWHVGDQWWALRKGSHLSARADGPLNLKAALCARGVRPVDPHPTPVKADPARA